MLATDPHGLRGQFIDILGLPDLHERENATKGLLKHIKNEGITDRVEDMLPLDIACSNGDLRMMKLYLENKALASSDSLKQLVIAVKRIRKTEKRASIIISRVIDLTKEIYECAEFFNATYPTEIKFQESFHLACFIAEPQNKRYCSKGVYKLPASVFFKRNRAYVLFPRKDNHDPLCNLIGGGSYKDVYPALKVNIKSRKVFLAAQLVPCKHDCLFERSILEKMHQFTKLGTGFPRIDLSARFYSEKKHSPRDLVVQPYWEGESLRLYTRFEREINNLCPLFLSAQINIAICLARGIKKAHHHGLVHGDIKPHNCLYDGHHKACLTDFDLSHEIGKKVLWFSKIFYGTAPYIPPEQLENRIMEEGSGQPGDMYALGLILYELALGRPAWYDRLVCHYNAFYPKINKIRDAYYEDNDYKKYTMAIHNLFKDSYSRERIVEMQKSVLEPLEQLEAIHNKSLEVKYRIMIYKLMHPDPLKRLNADQFYKESRKLKKELED